MIRSAVAIIDLGSAPAGVKELRNDVLHRIFDHLLLLGHFALLVGILVVSMIVGSLVESVPFVGSRSNSLITQRT